MKTHHTTLLAAMSALALAFLLVGCERTISHEEQIKVDDNKVKTKETTVTEQPDGSIQKTEEKKTTTTSP